ncbi:hypothetical protein IPC691_07965 [Pseudomonas aeruginosa]|nr:hypothetical protein AAY82_03715 [Pseudomonas aeruginosa]KSC16364.1 hypothetical protein AO878_10395 [Pseudomonas aeruginosa]KZE27655.1 hypothetical protein AVT06_22330 [Pseudomonas aeruginosa]RPY28797.1 hypothetical protein IPC690_03680 [Pseudomonas aeruginosa]RPY36334.1 hypothetical protein IPC691_07965 [Pseudomonas aeruginosa]
MHEELPARVMKFSTYQFFDQLVGLTTGLLGFFQLIIPLRHLLIMLLIQQVKPFSDVGDHLLCFRDEYRVVRQDSNVHGEERCPFSNPFTFIIIVLPVLEGFEARS